MNLPVILFFICALLSVLGAVLLIVAREPIHAALSLILVMIALAVLYLLLGAEFIAAVQILVYAGAIMVLFVTVIMVLNAEPEERTDFSKIAKYIGLPLAFVLLLEMAHWLYRSSIGGTVASGSGIPAHALSTWDLSTELFRRYLFPFEATSFLILIAVLGAMILARRDE